MMKKRAAPASSTSHSSDAPPLKRQKVVVASSSSSLSNEAILARFAHLEQRLQIAEDKVQVLEHQVKKTRYGPSWNGTTTNVDTMDCLNRLSPLAKHYNPNSIDQFIRDIPPLLWQQDILQPFLGLQDVAVARRSCTFLEEHYQRMLAQRIIRVPQDVPTLNKALEVASMLAERIVFTKTNPIKIVLDEGEHRIVGDDNFGQMLVTCSNISFIGKGADKTFVLGGFKVGGQINVLFQQFNLSNTVEAGHGVWFYQNAACKIVDCIVQQCSGCGLHVETGANVTATRCEIMENGEQGVLCGDTNTKVRLNDCTMHHNGGDGLTADYHCVVDLHGTKTDIHSNKQCGIRASSRCKVNIHLPSQHNTSHDNAGEGRHQQTGGSIANINADGTFTHAVAGEE